MFLLEGLKKTCIRIRSGTKCATDRFSEICEDVASLARGGHFNCHLMLSDTKDTNDLINYGLMANPMRGKTDQYLKMWYKKLGGRGACPTPRKFLKFVLQMVHSESI